MLLAGHHVGPERFDISGLQQTAPGRHAVLAVGDGIDEAVMLAGRKSAEIEGTVGIVHVRAVTGRTVAGVKIGATGDLLFGEFLRGFFRGLGGDGREANKRESTNECDAKHGIFPRS